MNRLHVSIAMTLWLMAVWVAVFSSVSWLVLLSGFLLALLVQVVLPMPNSPGIWHFRLLYAITLVLRFVWDLVRAGVQVAGLVLSNGSHEDGIVECRLRSGNPVYMTIVAAMCSMIPGTVVLKVDPASKTMYLHCLDLPGQGGLAGVRDATEKQEKRVLLAFATNRAVVEAGYGKYLPLAQRRLGRAEAGNRTPIEREAQK